MFALTNCNNRENLINMCYTKINYHYKMLRGEYEKDTYC